MALRLKRKIASIERRQRAAQRVNEDENCLIALQMENGNSEGWRITPHDFMSVVSVLFLYMCVCVCVCVNSKSIAACFGVDDNDDCNRRSCMFLMFFVYDYDYVMIRSLHYYEGWCVLDWSQNAMKILRFLFLARHPIICHIPIPIDYFGHRRLFDTTTGTLITLNFDHYSSICIIKNYDINFVRAAKRQRACNLTHRKVST